MTGMPVPPSHADHDELLIAAYAAGDASGDELDRASALVGSCVECARLHRDLRALASALSAAPAPARPRDFRLSAEQARRLERPGLWRRLLAPLAGARSAAGPIAASMAALGVAGLLLGGVVDLGLGGGATSTAALAPKAAASAVASQAAAAAGAGSTTGDQGYAASGVSSAPPEAATGAAPLTAAASPASSAGPAQVSSAPSARANEVPTVLAPAPSDIAAASPEPSGASDKSATFHAAEASPPEDTAAANAAGSGPGEVGSEPPGEAPGGPSPVVVGSLVLLIAGIALGLLRLVARRAV